MWTGPKEPPRNLLARLVVLSNLALAALLVGMPRTAIAQDCSGYATVQEFNGQLHYTWAADYALDETDVRRRHDASVSLHLVRQTPNFPGFTQITFEGPGIGTATIHDRFTDTITGEVTSFDGSGTPVHDGGQGGINLMLDLATCEYSLFWSVNVGVPAPVLTLGLGKIQGGRRALPSGPPAPLQATPNLKARGLLWLFQGLEEDAYVTVVDLDDPPSSAATDWSLVPGPPEDLELIVSIPTHATWLPEAGVDELTRAVGKELELRATLQKVGGGQLTFPPQSIEFTLLSASREPGVAMNSPVKSKLQNPAKPDLRFDPTLQLARQLSVPDADGATARTLTPPLNGTATAVLSTYDWGAYGILQVTALTADGTRLIGELDTDRTKTEIEIPKRTLPLQVADEWKDNEGVPLDTEDMDDGETEPVGDGGAGDGLSLYEEYRGFILNGKHSRQSANDATVDPLLKDVFVRNCIGGDADRGIALFGARTSLRVHAQIRDSELSSGKRCPGDVDAPDADRIINFNSTAATHVVDQHAIVLIASTAADANRARGGPGLPRQVSRVVIADGSGITQSATPDGAAVTIDVEKRARYVRTVAHELGHAVNVYHHGKGDLDPVQWREQNGLIVEQAIGSQSSDGTVELEGPARQIVVLTEEGGQPITASALGLPSTVYVGVQKGEHSGVHECFMRYEDAVAFVPAFSTTPSVRYLIARETAGEQLCSSPVGTGVNEPPRESPPGPRFGDADTALERGDCVHQLRVNDKLTDRAR